MGDVGAFLGHVLWNFWTIVAGFMISIEPVARFFWHGYDTWAARWLSANRRKRLARGGALLAFVIANYLAFHDVSEQLRTAQSNSTTSLARHLSNEERLRFVSELRTSPVSGIVEVMSTCDECEEYAQEFRDALHSFKDLKVSGGLGMFATAASRGIKIVTATTEPSPLALKFGRAFNAAALRYEWAEQENVAALGKDYLLIVVGRPRR
jgi:hypothetical protein